ncbi:MAG TPA: UDP-N-acetylmuramoyl-L-alanine--D-glutamate ligase [Bryobacteraceae bacterium]|jgi:UDP-N-acetylmuramoylalanine--D-glutamate ligase
MKVEGRKVVVVGMAKSGRAAVDLLIERGAHVTAVDQKPVPDLAVPVLPQSAISFADATLIVLSPGVPADLPEIQPARDRGVPIVGDLELASWFLQGEIIGITGSNGKTTTTALTGHILKSSGIASQVGGNIGTPPCSMVKTSRPDQWNVLELSSFQLETIETFRAHIGVALNVTPDHLDRHYTFERYAAAKAQLFENQRPSDFAVLNADDPTTYGFAQAPKTYWFSATSWADAYLFEENILLFADLLMPAAEIPLRGLHNLENTMAAALATHLAGATHQQIREAVKTFPGVEHRLEFVRTLHDVAWYNDSKATNVDATLKAIAAFEGNLWIILGGKDKNTDYTPLAGPIRQKAHAALLIGAAAEKIAAQLQGAAPLISCGTLEAAITEARAKAQPCDTVLLAPACASFDQFENFEHRGREFKRLVHSLE